jgi:hypothetical protein
MSRALVHTESRPEVLGRRGEKYIKINLSEIDSGNVNYIGFPYDRV